MGRFTVFDSIVLVAYLACMAGIGWYFSLRAKSTERYFVGGRGYPGWLIGISLFGATISSITFVGYPADAFKVGYLRYLICLMLPLCVYVASRLFVPFFRRGRITSVFEYLEGRYGPRTRVYGATVFIIAQCIRISLIQYLVALLINKMTGWNVPACILLGGIVTAYYTVAGGIEAVIWTDFIQSIVLTFGGLLILAVIIYRLPEGFRQIIQIGAENGKFAFTELRPDGSLHAVPWGLSLSNKTIVMMFIVGIFQWLAEYSTNQEVIQKYCAAKSAKEARRAMWVCCLCCVPTWGYFMFVGTGLFVFYHIFPDGAAAEMLSGARKAEEILPYFITTQLPVGFAGIVVAAVLAAAMSSMSSAMNSISAVAITDIYKRHMAGNRDDRHYVKAARLVTLASSVIMIAGAYWLLMSESKTLQDLWTELQAIVAGGLLGLYMLGFFTMRGDGPAVGVGILTAVAFSALISLAELGWLPSGITMPLKANFDSYYTGIISNVLMFGIGYAASHGYARRTKDLTNMTVWTQQPLEEPNA
jgi:SSS family solute:Na+ symporter